MVAVIARRPFGRRSNPEFRHLVRDCNGARPHQASPACWMPPLPTNDLRSDATSGCLDALGRVALECAHGLRRRNAEDLMSKRMLLAVALALAASAAPAQAQEVKVGFVVPYTGVGAELGQAIDR